MALKKMLYNIKLKKNSDERVHGYIFIIICQATPASLTCKKVTRQLSMLICSKRDDKTKISVSKTKKYNNVTLKCHTRINNIQFLSTVYLGHKRNPSCQQYIHHDTGLSRDYRGYYFCSIWSIAVYSFDHTTPPHILLMKKNHESTRKTKLSKLIITRKLIW